METKHPIEVRTDSIELGLIDDLIKRIYDAIKDELKEKSKIGDFIKMVELKHKLLAANASQKQLWNMLEKIRRQTLPSGNDSTTSGINPRPSRRTKKTSGK